MNTSYQLQSSADSSWARMKWPLSLDPQETPSSQQVPKTMPRETPSSRTSTSVSSVIPPPFFSPAYYQHLLLSIKSVQIHTTVFENESDIHMKTKHRLFQREKDLLECLNFLNLAMISILLFSSQTKYMCLCLCLCLCLCVPVSGLRRALSMQSLSQVEVPFQGVTLNRCLFIAITILVITSGFQRLNGT